MNSFNSINTLSDQSITAVDAFRKATTERLQLNEKQLQREARQQVMRQVLALEQGNWWRLYDCAKYQSWKQTDSHAQEEEVPDF